MRTVILRHLDVENFKGISKAGFSFDCKETSIIGDNGAGKTSLYDAYLWLLLGEDSCGSHVFKIQPLDDEGNLIRNLETKVSAVFATDGNELILRKELTQKWKTIHGEGQSVFCGHASKYYVNGIPQKESEYKNKVSDIFGRLDNVSLLSSVHSFNKLDMGRKREKLLEMAGEVGPIINSGDFPHLYPLYLKHGDVDSVKVIAKEALKRLEAKKLEIPGRISENELDLPKGIDFELYRGKASEIEQEIAFIDAKLNKTSGSRKALFDDYEAKTSALQSLESELSEIESSIRREHEKKIAGVRSEISQVSVKLDENRSKVRVIDDELASCVSRRESCTSQLEEIKMRFNERNKETFTFDNSGMCPTCKRPFSDEEMREIKTEAIRAFNTGKVAVLRRLRDEGEVIISKISDLDVSISDLNSRKKSLTDSAGKLLDDLTRLETSLGNIPSVEELKGFNLEYKNVLAKRDEARRALLDDEKSDNPESEVIARKNKLQDELKDVLRTLAREDNIKKVENRRKELQDELADIVSGIAEYETVLQEAALYEKAYIYAVERKVSSLFKHVSWQLYEPNISNDGEKKKCECMIGGIPYSSNLNTASRINAGIDIVNAISAWCGISVPLWVDGKESVINLIDTPSQVITLSVKSGACLSVE